MFRNQKFNLRKNRLLVKKALIAAALAATTSAQAADYYDVVDLGVLDFSDSEAFSINNDDAVVGNLVGVVINPISVADITYSGFVSQNGVMSQLSTLPLEDDSVGKSYTFHINNGGLAVGASYEQKFGLNEDGITVIESDFEQAVYFDTNNDTTVAVPLFEGGQTDGSRAAAISDNNFVVGFMLHDPEDDLDEDGNLVDGAYPHGFIYDIDGDELFKISPLDAGAFNRLTMRDINQNGLAVGVSAEVNDDGFFIRAVLVDMQTPDAIEQLPIFGGREQQPHAINDSNVVVGKAIREDSFNYEAFRYDIGSGEVTGLGFLNDSFPVSDAFDINESGQIVGSSQFENVPANFHAFLYENGEMKNLNSLIDCDTGWILNEARSINDSTTGMSTGSDDGIIVGTGILNGQKRAFKLIPKAGTAPVCEVEEDDSGSGSLSLSGLLLLPLLGWRRRKSSK